MKEKKMSIGERLARKYNSDMPIALQKGKFLFVFFLCLPAVLGFIVWYCGVNFQSIAMAFQDAQTGEWSLINFERIINELSNPKSEIYIALINTMKYFVLSAFIIPIFTYFIAYYIYKKIKFYKFFLVMLYLPSIVSGVVIGNMLKNVISPLGPISQVMNELGHGLLPNLLGDSKTATNTLLFIVFLLGVDTNVLLWIGTFKRIPQEVSDAAKIDGATETQELFRIVTPMVSSTAATLLILGCCGIFTASGPILYYTNGAANTTTLSFWIFSQTYNNSLLNYPAAVGIFFTFIGMPFVLFMNWLCNKVTKRIEY